MAGTAYNSSLTAVANDAGTAGEPPWPDASGRSADQPAPEAGGSSDTADQPAPEAGGSSDMARRAASPASYSARAQCAGSYSFATTTRRRSRGHVGFPSYGPCPMTSSAPHQGRPRLRSSRRSGAGPRPICAEPSACSGEAPSAVPPASAGVLLVDKSAIPIAGARRSGVRSSGGLTSRNVRSCFARRKKRPFSFMPANTDFAL